LGDFRVTESDKRKALAYYSNISHDYEGVVSANPILRFFRRREREAIESYLDIHRAKSLADVGCGSGTWALHGKQNGLWVKAIDANERMLDRLKTKVDATEVADIDGWSPKETYDRVVCAGVLDFVLSPEKAFESLCKAVAPGGRLVILVPRTGFWGNYYRLEKALIRVRVNLYSPRWLEAEARKYGLILVGKRVPLPSNLVAAFESKA
jgi:SAM-dependent methyltransferase